jgi:hypothetical protein
MIIICRLMQPNFVLNEFLDDLMFVRKTMKRIRIQIFRWILIIAEAHDCRVCLVSQYILHLYKPYKNCLPRI